MSSDQSNATGGAAGGRGRLARVIAARGGTAAPEATALNTRSSATGRR